MDENGEILLLHASKNNVRPLILPCALHTLVATHLENICQLYLMLSVSSWNSSPC